MFSDGKLSSGISNPRATDVLDFVRFWRRAILWDYKPHIGTDRLPDVVAGYAARSSVWAVSLSRDDADRYPRP